MKDRALFFALFGALLALAFAAGRVSVDERAIVRRVTERVTADSVLDFQRAAFAAGFLRHEPIRPGETPKWVWKTREEVWREVDQETIAEFSSQPQQHQPQPKPQAKK